MERVLVCFLLLSVPVSAILCPKRCTCQNLLPSYTVLCAKTGLLFVPPNIDRRTAELRLMDNFITTLRKKDFANMTSLIHLSLSRNTISQITPFAFVDLHDLHALHLDSNRLTLVNDEHFQGLINLRHLILSNNQLQSISEGNLRGFGPILQQSHDLHALHLDSNRLTLVNDEHFQGLINLRHLILSNNQLQSIAEGSFEDFLETLEDLDLSYNNLREIPWDTITRLVSVNTLSLDHNLIEFVPEGIFSNLHKLARLDMTSNKLKKIPPDPLFLRIPVYAKMKGSPLTSLVLSFGGNPLHCNCELVWLRRLTREDDLETCASPRELMGKYFWTIKEEEFICEPPMITRHTSKMFVMEGQEVSLRCKAIGDPEPSIHWISPEGKVIANTSRTISYENGSLDILTTTIKDSGMFTCISSNAAGESTAPIELIVNPFPLLTNRTSHMKESEPEPSDILTSVKSANETSGKKNKRVLATEVTSSSVVIKWTPQNHIPGIRMYQIQYNSSSDGILIYR
ncbi:UNVERIFIED_CONTAM: hypothetical protein FKN15_034234 [Acipenser sinensis]